MVDEITQLSEVIEKIIRKKSGSPSVLREVVEQLNFLESVVETSEPFNEKYSLLTYIREAKKHILTLKDQAEGRIKEIEDLRERWWRTLAAINNIAKNGLGELEDVKSQTIQGQRTMPIELKKILDDLARTQKDLINLSNEMLQGMKTGERFEKMVQLWWTQKYFDQIDDVIKKFVQRIGEFEIMLPRAAEKKVEAFGRGGTRELEKTYGEMYIFERLDKLLNVYKQIKDFFEHSEIGSLNAIKTLTHKTIQTFKLR